MSKKLDDHLKEKGSYFASVTHDLELAQSMIQTLPDFSYWAYIFHQPDTDDGTPHFHFLVRNNGSRSVKQIADKLGISGQYVQVCRKVVGYRRYMLHLDDDDKMKYSLGDIKTNSIGSFKEAIVGNDNRDVSTLYKDFKLLTSGVLTPDEFIEKNYVALNKMNSYQKLKTFELIFKFARTT